MDGRTIDLRLHTSEGVREAPFEVRRVVIAGWTGRDVESVEAHIRELEALGVPRPKETPVYYRVSRELVTTAPSIQVVGPDTSGEIECVLFIDGEDIYLGLGSDHTDRKLEAISVTQSKQVCSKPVGRDVWKLSDVLGHWDELQMESWADGRETAYQTGVTAFLRPAMELLATYKARSNPDTEGMVMFCGTLPVHGGVKPHARLDFTLRDPVLGRELRHGYTVDCLPGDP